MKRFFALFFVFVLLICLTVPAWAEEGEEPVDLWDCEAYGHDYHEGICIYCGSADPGDTWDCDAGGHEYQDGQCIYCGSADPGDTWDCDANGHEYQDGQCIHCGVSESEVSWVCDVNGHVYQDGQCIHCGDIEASADDDLLLVFGPFSPFLVNLVSDDPLSRDYSSYAVLDTGSGPDLYYLPSGQSFYEFLSDYGFSPNFIDDDSLAALDALVSSGKLAYYTSYEELSSHFGQSLRGALGAVDLSGVLLGILQILPVVLVSIVSFVGIRKAFSFVSQRMRGS